METSKKKPRLPAGQARVAADIVTQVVRDFRQAEHRWLTDPDPVTEAVMKCRKIVMNVRVMAVPALSASSTARELNEEPQPCSPSSKGQRGYRAAAGDSRKAARNDFDLPPGQRPAMRYATEEPGRVLGEIFDTLGQWAEEAHREVEAARGRCEAHGDSTERDAVRYWQTLTAGALLACCALRDAAGNADAPDLVIETAMESLRLSAMYARGQVEAVYSRFDADNAADLSAASHWNDTRMRALTACRTLREAVEWTMG